MFPKSWKLLAFVHIGLVGRRLTFRNTGICARLDLSIAEQHSWTQFILNELLCSFSNLYCSLCPPKVGNKDKCYTGTVLTSELLRGSWKDPWYFTLPHLVLTSILTAHIFARNFRKVIYQTCSFGLVVTVHKIRDSS